MAKKKKGIRYGETRTVQDPLVKYAGEIGWKRVTRDEALTLRRGEGGRVFYPVLEDALLRLNPGLVTMENVGAVIARIESARDSIEGNQEVLCWLRGERTIYDETEKRDRNVRLLDEGELENNVFQVTDEWQYTNGLKTNRGDVVFLINGIPVALVETKNAKKPHALEEGLIQIRRYHRETPEMLTMPQVFDLTQLLEIFYGATWSTERKGLFKWKKGAGGATSYEARVKAFFDRERFLKLLCEWILFFVKDDELRKAILHQHQTRAVEKVLDRCADPVKKAGLVWHTQGSGKTFTMICTARMLLEDPDRFGGQPTVLLVIDRNELEGQLQGWVERILAESGVAFEYAHTKKRLKELFAADFRGLIISMIHKFDKMPKDMCTRSNVFVLIDEAHRSTGGDLGNYLMAALPNATLIGFTGTPIDKTEYGKGTFKVFGKDDEQGYLDKYSIKESMEDGTTLRLRYAHAPSEMTVDGELLEKEFLSLAEGEGVSDVDELNKILDKAVKLKAFLKSKDHVRSVAAFVKEHFTENVQPLGYKAFLVAVDREACALYKQALDELLPPEVTAAVYTSAHNDSEKLPLVHKHQLGPDEEKTVRKQFAKPGRDPQILIVTDKLLTGYDAPVLYCMYLDKPMRDHVLLQAIARVNRPFEQEDGKKRKPCGLVIDFIGIFGKLKKALKFDSKDVSGVIENLDVLFAGFTKLMAEDAKRYLELAGDGDDDKALEAAIDAFSNKEEREEFFSCYKKIESLYEILSPSPDLYGFIDDFRQLAALYQVVRNAYGDETTYWGEVAAKTENLVRDEASAYVVRPRKTVRVDENFLAGLEESGESENHKIINLVRLLTAEAEEKGDSEPFLIPMAERARRILDEYSNDQKQTRKALKQLEELAQQKVEAEKQRQEMGLDVNVFAIFWVLKQEGLADRRGLAEEIDAAFAAFPNHEHLAEEKRQLKAEIYKSLLKEVDGKRMVEIADRIIGLNRTEDPRK
ncbi:type I restriction endonuclease subunit R [Haloferula sp. A504]|uniref:type I restriction endonuclease subunit R n=1 Tax=Haloferula sp. A504 TaxID=3373601 RepID=UPI0031C2F5A3|nr:HsdR family type I site-specific deoxyribonuclease [Verrucomicrobiaceae bacterium E54]